MNQPLNHRVADEIRRAVDRLRLDLAGLRVLTEAATGSYCVTPVIAAVAGAEVVAFTKDSGYGTADQVREETTRLAAHMGVAERITIVQSLTDEQIGLADIVTNSGHLRPLDAAFVRRMKRGAVIPLMYEAWELRATDVDLKACQQAGVLVAGTNERHPDVGVFDYLGLLVVKAVLQAGHDLIGKRCLLISDNDFAPYVQRTLEANGAKTVLSRNGRDVSPRRWDLVVIACTPPLAGGKLLHLEGLEADLYCQLWGDVRRGAGAGRYCPEREPLPGHMGLSLASLGPTPVVKLQAAGLKCGEVMLNRKPDADSSIVQRPAVPHFRQAERSDGTRADDTGSFRTLSKGRTAMAKLRAETLDNQQADTAEIDAFIEAAANGTTYHRPRFLSYHPAAKLDQLGVQFRHLAFWKRGKLVGFLPGAIVRCENGPAYQSPWGASIGGLVVQPDVNFWEVEEMVSVWQDRAAEWGARRVDVTLVPICFQRTPAQETVEFAMLRKGFVYSDCTLMMVVPVVQAGGFPESVLDRDPLRRIKEVTKRGYDVRVSNDLDAFWPLLVENKKDLGATPTHSKEEMETLLRLMPHAFRMHMAFVEDHFVGGMILFRVCSRAASGFHICYRKDARELCLGNLLYFRALQWAREGGLDWMDFGPSTFGMQPHLPLIHFKEQHGGRGVLRRKMQATLPECGSAGAEPRGAMTVTDLTP